MLSFDGGCQIISECSRLPDDMALLSQCSCIYFVNVPIISKFVGCIESLYAQLLLLFTVDFNFHFKIYCQKYPERFFLGTF